MKRDIAEKWAIALESGEFRQTKRQLHDTTGYCCLGVLCEILKVPYRDHDIDLPVEAMEIAGMTNRSGGFLLNEGDKQMEFLSNLNDKGMSFEKIAKVIRENVDKL